MFPPEIFNKPVWCYYDDMNGNTLLKYPLRKGEEVPCPRCEIPLQFLNYRAHCCAYDFKAGFGEARQVQAAGTHSRASGRGWASIRPAPVPLL
jgi:hypothetical protein